MPMTRLGRRKCNFRDSTTDRLSRKMAWLYDRGQHKSEKYVRASFEKASELHLFAPFLGLGPNFFATARNLRCDPARDCHFPKSKIATRVDGVFESHF